MDRRTNERQAWYLAFYEVARAWASTLRALPRAVEAVTAADVQRATSRTSGSTPTTLILGPRSAAVVVMGQKVTRPRAEPGPAGLS